MREDTSRTRSPHALETAARPRWILEAVAGRDKGRAWPLEATDVSVGRHTGSRPAGAWVLVAEPSVSSHHAVLRWDDARGCYRLVHRSQTNPTLLNGRPVEDAWVGDGDTLQMGHLVVRLVAASATPAAEAAASPGPVRLRALDAAQMFGQLSVMLQAGLPMVRAMDALARQAGSGPVASQLLVQILRGASLSQAMQTMPGVFTPFHAQSVAAGEACGALPTVLQELAECEERNVSLVRTVTASLTYPLVVFACGLALVIFLGNRVFVSILPALTQSGQALPWLTRLVGGLAHALQSPPVLALLGILGLATALWVRQALGTERGRWTLDRLLLRLPGFGVLVRKLFVVRFCRCLGLLYDGGIPLMAAVEGAAACATNRVLRAAVLQACDTVTQGATLAVALRTTGAFPEMLVGMVAVGEDAGQLGGILKKLADLFDVEVQESVRVLITLLEPLIIVSMGVAVAVIVVATLLPMYRVVGGG